MLTADYPASTQPCKPVMPPRWPGNLEVLGMAPVTLGLENFIGRDTAELSGKRLGLLANPASVDRRLRHARNLLAERYPGQLSALFSPQHGFFAEKQDNMVESDHRRDPRLGIPVFSLYGQTRVPSADMMAAIDTLIIDLQDVGTRVYTFIYTMSYCLEAARRYGKQVVVLDRPNPVNGLTLEGNCLLPEFASFVGRYPIPMRHGLTIGELALLFNDHFAIACDLQVVPMTGWQRRMFFSDTGLPWIAPSPNLPTPISALVYPGQVIWEGTNVSEGRGTTQPFEIFGAPFLDSSRIIDFSGISQLPGVTLRPTEFEPTSNKWRGQICRGFQIHVTDPGAYRPFSASLRILQAVMHHHGDHLQWKPPPYEYEFIKLPIDLILGDGHLRQQLAAMEPVDTLERHWAPALEAFDDLSRAYRLYT
jgi:uncharacterized protein YbbC (DUF1343 family)